MLSELDDGPVFALVVKFEVVVVDGFISAETGVEDDWFCGISELCEENLNKFLSFCGKFDEDDVDEAS